MAYRTIGNTVVEWEDDEPFLFTMTQQVGVRDHRVSKIITIHFTKLRHGYTEKFLNALKDFLIERCKKVKLITIETEWRYFESLLARAITKEFFDTKIAVIDEAFLLCLAAEKNEFTAHQLKFLRTAFSANLNRPGN